MPQARTRAVTRACRLRAAFVQAGDGRLPDRVGEPSRRRILDHQQVPGVREREPLVSELGWTADRHRNRLTQLLEAELLGPGRPRPPGL